MSGYIKVYRSTFDHEMFGKDEFSRRDAWLWIISRAAWRPMTKRVSGTMLQLERGQIADGSEYMSSVFKWSRKRVRIFMDQLAAQGMIEVGPSKGRLPAIITVCNYDEFQSDGPVEGQLKASKGPVKGQLRATIKEGEEGKEEESTPNGVLVTHEACDPDLLGEPVKAKRSKSQPIMEAFAAYNETAERCGLRQATQLNPSRRKSIGARLRESGWDGWQQMLANVERSGFLTGTNDRQWRADLDWLIKPANFVKVLEGRYGNGRHASHAKSDGPTLEELYSFTEAAHAPG